MDCRNIVYAIKKKDLRKFWYKTLFDKILIYLINLKDRMFLLAKVVYIR